MASDPRTGPMTDGEIWHLWCGTPPLGMCKACPGPDLCIHDIADFARALLAEAGERVIAERDLAIFNLDTGKQEDVVTVEVIKRVLGVKETDHAD